MRSIVPALLLTLSAIAAEDGVRKMDVWPGGGIFAQVVDSAEWRTAFHLTNVDNKTIYAGLIFMDDAGAMMRLPIGGMTPFSVGFALEANQTMVISTEGFGALKQGWAGLFTCDIRCSDPASKPVQSKVAAAAILRQSIPGRQDSEAVVPMDVPDKPVLLLFDNRNGYSTGMALVNVMSSTQNYSIRVLDSQGLVVGEESLALPPDQKRVFVISTRYPQSAGRYGHVVISGGPVVAMGLRFSPNGSFTSSHAMTVIPLSTAP
jgi:hypothetical protein